MAAPPRAFRSEAGSPEQAAASRLPATRNMRIIFSSSTSMHYLIARPAFARWRAAMPPNPRGASVPPPAARSDEHTSDLQSLMRISYAVFCLIKNILVEHHITTQRSLHLPLTE